MGTYTKRVDNKKPFKEQIFKKFTDAVGGDLDEFTEMVYNRFTVEDFQYSDDSIYWQVHGYFQNVVVPHKIEVYKAGLEITRHPEFSSFLVDKEQFLENLWLHDISKFSANESFGYAMHDFKSDKYHLSFEVAWNHHKNHNPHHPEYWISVGKMLEIDIQPMARIYVLEMIADWIGAGTVYGNPIEKWLSKNIHLFYFHPNTAEFLSTCLKKLGINSEFEPISVWADASRANSSRLIHNSLIGNQ